MRIGSSTDKKDSGRIHVDFAQARDDLYEWECKQRLLAREERHRRKIHEERLRPPSPPPIVHYSEHEAALLAEKLKGGQTWGEQVQSSWIHRLRYLNIILCGATGWGCSFYCKGAYVWKKYHDWWICWYGYERIKSGDVMDAVILSY